MKPRGIFSISLIVILVLFLIAFILIPNNKEISKVCFKENCFSVELAKTASQQEQGLMFRESLESSSGMLFIFEKSAVYSFWMKNTKIPLDIIWINSDKEVVFISSNTPLCKEEPCSSINPNQEASYVLEVNAGVCKKVNLKVGDKLELK